MNQICDQCKFVSGFSSEFPCNRCVVIAINCFSPNNAALQSNESPGTVRPVGPANNRRDEIADIATSMESAAKVTQCAIEGWARQLRAVR